MTAQTILVAGATGWLGRKIAEEAQARGVNVRLLLRGGARNPKAAELQSLTAKGAEIVAGDLNDPAALDRAAKGVNVVVSAVQGGHDVILDGQVALAKAAKANGARRMFPSDFAATYKHLTPDQHPFLSLRASADAAIAQTGLTQSNTVNGAFMETLLAPFLQQFDAQAGVLRFWGSPDQACDYTHTDDVAAFVAAAALDPNAPDGDFRIVGDTATMDEAAETLSRVLDRKIKPESRGSLDALAAETAKLQAAHPNDPGAWIALKYHWLMASGEGRVLNTHNHLYPDVEPRGLEPFLREALKPGA
jgi:uncharacterized protein YbjT (DUF2867 family)